MRHQSEDILFGGHSEVNNLSILETYFQTKLKHNGTFHCFDYSNDSRTIFVELKTRRINHNQYPTAIIGKNKVDFCNDPNVDYYFVFCYSDGLYTIKYEKELFNSFKVETEYMRSYRTGCVNKPQVVVHIPYQYLIKIDSSLGV